MGGVIQLAWDLKNTNSSNDTNVEPNSALLLEFFKNTNSSNDTNVEPNSALLLEFFKNTNRTNRTNADSISSNKRKLQSPKGSFVLFEKFVF